MGGSGEVGRRGARRGKGGQAAGLSVRAAHGPWQREWPRGACTRVAGLMKRLCAVARCPPPAARCGAGPGALPPLGGWWPAPGGRLRSPTRTPPCLQGGRQAGRTGPRRVEAGGIVGICVDSNSPSPFSSPRHVQGARWAAAGGPSGAYSTCLVAFRRCRRRWAGAGCRVLPLHRTFRQVGALLQLAGVVVPSKVCLVPVSQPRGAGQEGVGRRRQGNVAGAQDSQHGYNVP